MPASVDRLDDPFHLVDASHGPGCELVESSIDGVALRDGEVAASFEKRHVGADAASIDPSVEQKLLTLFWQQWLQAGMIIGRTRAHDVGLATLEQEREVALARGGVFGILALFCGLWT